MCSGFADLENSKKRGAVITSRQLQPLVWAVIGNGGQSELFDFIIFPDVRCAGPQRPQMLEMREEWSHN